MSALAAPEFTPEAYQLAIPGMDGYKAEKIAVAFSGGVDLDRTSTEDLDFVNGLTLGKQVTLTVVATVTKKGFSLTTKDEIDAAGYGVGLKVHSLEVV